LGLLQGDPKNHLQWRPPIALSVSQSASGSQTATLTAGVLMSATMAAQATATASLTTRISDAQISDLITQRTAAKAAKNFTEADRIRKQLLESGIVLKDTPSGTTWESQ
jgi:cysteinyl-tRNA synthetase